MMPDLSKLAFGNSTFCREGDFVARVPQGLTNRDDLFTVLRRELRLPDYFGGNWDALSECLRDLSWINARRIIIEHRDLPGLDSETLGTYLDILVECVQDWKSGEEHELFVVFPQNSRDAILNILGKTSGN